MQLTLNGQIYSIVPGIGVKISPSIWQGPGGPDVVYPVTSVDDQANVFFIADPASTEEVPLPDISISPDAISEVDSPSVQLVTVDLGGGITAAVTPDAARIINDQIAIVKAQAQQIEDFRSGAAVQDLQNQIDNLNQQSVFYKNSVVLASQAFDLGAAILGLQKIKDLLGAAPPSPIPVVPK